MDRVQERGMSDKTAPLPQECADFATSLRSAYNVARLAGKAPPSFLRAAELFERAAMELAAAEQRAAAAEAEAEALRRDAERLDWLLHHLSGKEMRRIGIVTSGGGPLWGRVAIDAAIAGRETSGTEGAA
jgi:hypothetical protein